jgi:ElaB/YqjD/DUF883 family membrane-anchored ribosome-binding protein
MKSEKKLRELVNDVEELLAELRDEHGPEVAELRERIENNMQSTKAAIGRRSAGVTARVGRYVDSLDSYINHYPRLAFATATLVAGWVGYVSGITAHRRHRRG